MLAKGHFVREKQVEIFGVHEWGFCHEALDMTLGLFLTKVEGFVLIQKNYECSKRQQFGRSRPSGRYIQQSAIGQKRAVFVQMITVAFWCSINHGVSDDEKRIS